MHYIALQRLRNASPDTERLKQSRIASILNNPKYHKTIRNGYSLIKQIPLLYQHQFVITTPLEHVLFS